MLWFFYSLRLVNTGTEGGDKKLFPHSCWCRDQTLFFFFCLLVCYYLRLSSSSSRWFSNPRISPPIWVPFSRASLLRNSPFSFNHSCPRTLAPPSKPPTSASPSSVASLSSFSTAPRRYPNTHCPLSVRIWLNKVSTAHSEPAQPLRALHSVPNPFPSARCRASEI
jgi:hypothetical protein